MSEYLFVYGTLMRGLAAHERMETERVRYVGEGTISGALYDLGPYPALRLDEEGTVHGEVYELVDDAMICELDEYEGYHGHPEICRYIRSAVPVHCAGETLEAWVYYYNPRRKMEGAVLVESGDYRSVRREGNA
jgi:gamma-glutamylcyclotransferase (GGCT)/AIG2-like uncharacterized protein YtfP